MSHDGGLQKKKKSTSENLEPLDGMEFGERLFADVKEPEVRLSWVI